MSKFQCFPLLKKETSNLCSNFFRVKKAGVFRLHFFMTTTTTHFLKSGKNSSQRINERIQRKF